MAVFAGADELKVVVDVERGRPYQLSNGAKLLLKERCPRSDPIELCRDIPERPSVL